MLRPIRKVLTFLWSGDIVKFVLEGPTQRLPRVVFEIVKYTALAWLVQASYQQRKAEQAQGKRQLVNFQYRFF
jgi:hypothetical protein